MSPSQVALAIIRFIVVVLLVCLTPVVFVLEALGAVITLPYTMRYPSPNFGLAREDYEPVLVYLRHFERLHPTLIAHVAAYYQGRQQNRPPDTLQYWPNEKKSSHTGIPHVSGFTHRSWRFSTAAGLFAKLESSGWDRKMLWTFLRDQVESAGLVTPREKEAFAVVREKMNSHRYKGVAHIWVEMGEQLESWLGNDIETQQKRQQRRKEKALAKFGHLGIPVFMVSEDSIDWILQGKALLVPLRAFPPFLPLWKQIRKTTDLERGQDYWQLIY